jgi:hypothetical protein
MSEDDFIKETKTPPPGSATAKTETTDENKTAEAQPKLTEAIKNASASTAVGALNVMLTGCFIPAQNFKLKKKFKKSFTPAQQKTLDEKLADADLEDITEKEEKLLKKRFDSIIKKYQKKVEAVPMNESEKKDFHEACKNYMDLTGKSLPPGLFLGMSLTQIVGNRVIDTLTD